MAADRSLSGPKWRPVSWDGRFAGFTHVPFPGRMHLPRLTLEGLCRQHFS